MKQDDSHKKVLSSGFSDTECGRLHFPKMATNISIPQALPLSDLATFHHELGLQPILEPVLSLVTYSKYNVAAEVSLETKARS